MYSDTSPLVFPGTKLGHVALLSWKDFSFLQKSLSLNLLSFDRIHIRRKLEISFELVTQDQHFVEIQVFPFP